MIDTVPLFALPAPRGQLDALELLEDVAPPTTGGPVPAATLEPVVVVRITCTQPSCRSTVEAPPGMAQALVEAAARAAGWGLGSLPGAKRCRYHR